MNQNLRLHFLEKIAVFSLLLFTVAKWTSSYLLSPDSIAYVDAGLSFAKTGAFFSHISEAQTVSPSLDPKLFNVYPLGLPFLISVFYWIFSDIFYATLVLHSLVFVFLYYSLCMVLDILRIKPHLRVLVFVFLTFSRIYQENFSYILSEPLFMAFSLQCLYHALCLQDSSKPLKKHLALAAVFCCLSALIRYNGTFNFLFTLYPIYTRLKEEKRPGFLGSYLNLSAWPVLAGSLPTGLYLLRNFLSLKTLSTYHTEFSVSREKLMALHPAYFSSMFGNSFIFLCIFAAFAAYFFYNHRNNVKVKMILATLGLTCLASAIVIWLLSVFSASEPVGNRYLGLSYLCFFICVVYAVSALQDKLSYVFLLLFMAFNHGNYFNPLKIRLSPLVRVPEERALWNDLLRDEKFVKIDYIFTDYYNYYHHMFSGKPLIFSQSLPGNPLMTKEVEKIIETHKNYKFASVYRCESPENKAWQDHLSTHGKKELKPVQKGSFCFYLPD